jgi:hypothetical protein
VAAASGVLALAAGVAAAQSDSPPMLGGCPVFPADNAWNRDISGAPVDPQSDAYVAAISRGGDRFLHADFGGGGQYGIPYKVVSQRQRKVPIHFDAYGDESNKGPYPIPLRAPVEKGSDRHVLVLQRGSCKLYELYAAHRSRRGWVAGSGAVFDLRSNALRPDGWTSADAAGLSIYAGLARYAEYAAGDITHAIRFTLPCTTNSRVSPASHTASPSYCAGNVNAPPMGLRMRLNASFDISSYKPTAQAFLRAFKRYGLILADNGGRSSTFFFQSETNANWNDDDINDLKRVPVSAFEAVDP